MVNKRTWLTLASAVALLLGCSNGRETPATGSSIIGDDDRQATKENRDTIGALMKDGEALCTAFRSGRGEVTTAAHCIDDETTGLEFRDGNGVDSAVIGKLGQVEKADIAVLQVEGNAGYLSASPFDTTKTTSIVSFHADAEKLVAASAGDALASDGLIFHTLDTTPGASGSPMLQDGKVVGIHLGHLPSIGANVAVTLANATLVDLTPIKGAIDQEARWRLPRINIRNPLEAAKDFIKREATNLAAVARRTGTADDYTDCVLVVSAGLVAWGTMKGGWIGAALGGGAAIGFSQFACRRVFP